MHTTLFRPEERIISISDQKRVHSTLFNLADKIGGLIRLSRDACYLSNSSEQDEQEEILEIAAIYEAICDPLPFLLPP